METDARTLLPVTASVDHAGAGCLDASHRRPWRALAAAAAAAAGLVAAAVLAQTDVPGGASTILLPYDRGVPARLAALAGSSFSWSAAARFRVAAGVALDKADLPPEMARAVNFSVNPCENFYEYTCGAWISESTIPADQTRTTKSWDGARRRVNEKLQQIVTSQWPQDSPYRKLNYWYDSCMDLEAVNALGAEPLRPMLDKIDRIRTLEDLQDYLVDVVPKGMPTLVDMDVKPGLRKLSTNLLFLNVGAMTFNRPEMYNETLWPGHIEALREYFTTLNTLAGSTPDEAERLANQTIALEQIFASWAKEDDWHHAWAGDPKGAEVSVFLPRLILNVQRGRRMKRIY